MSSSIDNLPPQVKAVVNKAQYYVAQIDKELEKYPALVKLESTTGVPKAYGTIGLFLIVTTFIFFNIAASFLTNALGFALPAYLSLRALETPGKDDDVQWLTYWVSFGFLTILESFSSIVLYYFPFYYTFKAVALIWLMQFGGAKTVYQKVLQPVFFHQKPVAATN